MRKIKNPYSKIEGYNCFGCSPNNESGLRMQFYEVDDFICCDWNPRDAFQGYKNVLHGGIQVTLMDEIASWVVQVKLKTAGVTSKIDAKFIKPLLVDVNKVHLKAKLNEMRRNIAIIDVWLFNENGELCSQATASYFTVREEMAREKFFYPGVDAFFAK
ncbi:MAG: PaaI family thioesterase [Bacteroidota bacterium]